MNIDSFTDEQLLNLVNNTIETKTEFTRNDFTGGSVIVTTTHNNTVKKFKVSLYFGYKGKHSINRQIDISQESYYVWTKAILIKVFSLDMVGVGMDLNELNLLMNSTSNSILSNSKKSGDTPVPTTVPKKSAYELFIEELKTKVTTPSKVTSTKQGRALFKQIEDKERLVIDYVSHQKEKGEFAQRITAYMEDYKPQKKVKRLG